MYSSGLVNGYYHDKFENSSFNGNSYIKPLYNFGQGVASVLLESKPYGFQGFPKQDTIFIEINRLVTGYIDNRSPYNNSVMGIGGSMIYTIKSSIVVNEDSITTGISDLELKTNTQIDTPISSERNIIEIFEKEDEEDEDKTNTLSVNSLGQTTYYLALEKRENDDDNTLIEKCSQTVTDSELNIKVEDYSDKTKTTTFDLKKESIELELSYDDEKKSDLSLTKDNATMGCGWGVNYTEGELTVGNNKDRDTDHLVMYSKLEEILKDIMEAINLVNASITTQVSNQTAPGILLNAQAKLTSMGTKS